MIRTPAPMNQPDTTHHVNQITPESHGCYATPAIGASGKLPLTSVLEKKHSRHGRPL
ncbi:MAG: hypothetical protein FWF25_00170 [Propionibacteriaceae bacterium]|nr:hypothetical protein [Propionibacteriaceae bacterium]